jgi:hypothetical protein
MIRLSPDTLWNLMKQIHKEYAERFVLEPTKLTRLIDTVHQLLGDHRHAAMRDHFEVFLSGNRHEELSSLDDVLALENSHKQRIQCLLITCSAGAEGALRAEHEIQVSFAGNTTNPSSSNRSAKVIGVSVRSDDSGWANRALSAVEEQVERTWQQHTPVITFLWSVSIGVVFLLLSLLGPSNGSKTESQTWLRDSDLDRLQQILDQNGTMTDDELREMRTREYRNILEAKRPAKAPQKKYMHQIVLVAGSLLIVLACSIILLTTCYPKEIFLWGDEETRYAELLNRRKVLWGVLVAMTVTGLGSKLLFAGMDSWLHS